MEILETSILTIAQKERIFKLWNDEYPQQLVFNKIAELENYLEPLLDKKHFFLKNDADESIGWAMLFSRDNEKWFAIIVHADSKGKGNGRALLSRLKEHEHVLNGWVSEHDDLKSDGKPYKSPLAFYLKNDFLLLPDIKLETPVLSAVKIVWTKK